MFDFSKRLEDFETGKPTGGRGARGKYNREERAPRSGGFQVVVVVNAEALALVMHQVVMVVLQLIVLPLVVVNEKLLVLQHVVVSVVADVQAFGGRGSRSFMLVVAVVVVVQVSVDGFTRWWRLVGGGRRLPPQPSYKQYMFTPTGWSRWAQVHSLWSNKEISWFRTRWFYYQKYRQERLWKANWDPRKNTSIYHGW
jgi:hypothetical protein